MSLQHVSILIHYSKVSVQYACRGVYKARLKLSFNTNYERNFVFLRPLSLRTAYELQRPHFKRYIQGI
jgi:hypothetical protein